MGGGHQKTFYRPFGPQFGLRPNWGPESPTVSEDEYEDMNMGMWMLDEDEDEAEDKGVDEITDKKMIWME